MSKVLVTGGAGFIGSHLCEALLQRGDEVWVLDDLSTGRVENVGHLQGDEAFHFFVGSILDFPLLQSLIQNVDMVFHLAAAVGVKKIIEAPVETIETNVLGSHHVLKLAARHRKLCLVSSSSEVYGKSTKHPYSEDDDVVYGPTSRSRWSYASSKAVDEFLAFAYHETQDLPVIIVRLFNTTGPRQTGRYGMVLPRFVDQALRGDPITVYGDGRQTRCFADVGDIVRALLLLIDHPAAVGHVFNVGNPEEVCIRKLAQMVKKLANSDSEICFVPYDKAYKPGFEDMHRRVPSINKISRLVGYRPERKLHEIICRMIDSRRGELTQSIAVPITTGLPAPSLSPALGE